jgi:hypothetical protein
VSPCPTPSCKVFDKMAATMLIAQIVRVWSLLDFSFSCCKGPAVVGDSGISFSTENRFYFNSGALDGSLCRFEQAVGCDRAAVEWRFVMTSHRVKTEVSSHPMRRLRSWNFRTRYQKFFRARHLAHLAHVRSGIAKSDGYLGFCPYLADF